MKTLVLVIVVAVAAFAGGIWYTREYAPMQPVGETPAPVTNSPTTNPDAPKPIYVNASADMIVIDAPKPGESVGTSFTVIGKARGGWYFEASFPLRVLSAQGSLLKEMPVQADGEWMTSEFVPFSETVTLPPGTKGAVTLVLQNDNPSGLPENAASISIPLFIQ